MERNSDSAHVLFLIIDFMICSNVYALQELLEAYEAEGKATGRPRLLITAAVAAGKENIDNGYEIAEIAK